MSAVRPKEVRAEDTHLLSQRIQSQLRSDVQEAGCPLFGPLLPPCPPTRYRMENVPSVSLSHPKERNTGLFFVFEVLARAGSEYGKEARVARKLCQTV